MTAQPQVIGWPAGKTQADNPYQALLYGAVQACGSPVVECTLRALLTAPRGSVLHLHWPDAFVSRGAIGWAVIRLLALRLLALWCALRGVAWVWTAHNYRRPTQRHATFLARAFWPWFLNRIDGIIYLTAASRNVLRAAAPRLDHIPNVLTRHGSYRVPPAAAPQPNRIEILFFGGVSPYKRVGDLVRAFVSLDRADLHLRIAGASSSADPDADASAALARVPAHLRPAITREDRFLDDAELAARLHAARLVVLPLAAVQNSGSALYALSAARPVLVPDLPPFRELREAVGDRWVHLFQGKLSGDDIARALAFAPRGAPDLRAFAWPGIAAQTVALYRKVSAA